MLHLNSAVLPARPAEWDALVDAVHRAAPGDEQDWLEWKSTLNLRDKNDIGSVLAKTILAMANRQPDVAAMAVEGRGIVVVGVEPQHVHGVQHVDNADLDKLVSKYVGSMGPKWQPIWTRYRDQHILIVVVGPPAWGDPIHPLRTEIGIFRNGMVFVRKRARSEPATATDIDELVERARRRSDEGLLLQLEVRSEAPLQRFTWPQGSGDRYVKAEYDRLMGPLSEARERRAAAEREQRLKGFTSDLGVSKMLLGLGSAMNSASSWDPISETVAEDRTEDEYLQQVEEYLHSLTAAWLTAMRGLAPYVVQAPQFWLRNQTARNYKSVEVQLHVGGEADADEAKTMGDGVDVKDLLPRAPRLWGPVTVSRHAFTLPTYDHDIPSLGPLLPQTRIERGGSFTLTFRPVNLRPKARVVIEDQWALLIPATRKDPVIAEWTATATNVEGQAEGRLPIAFEGDDVDVLSAVLAERPRQRKRGR